MTRTDSPHSVRAGSAAVPEGRSDRLRLFKEIEVVPPNELYFNGMLVDGGPIWPSFGTCRSVRFNRSRPMDRAPKSRSGPKRRIERPCVWGGFVQRHFGHLVADHLTRVVESLAERPDDIFLFVGYPNGTDRDIPAYFWSVIDWYGLPRAQVMIVREPLIVAELRCAPQAERLENFGPSARYLSALDDIMNRNGLKPKPDGLLYVAREGMLEAGKGGHAGEGYLVSVLRKLGVAVLDPAKAPLREQLEAYGRARTLVFAEGSALHGRQLLGRIEQDILVLNRRNGNAIARHNLEPRCRSLRYLEVALAVATPIGADGRVLDAEAISFLDTRGLFSIFQAFGVDAQSEWVVADFLKAQAADAAAWLRFTGAYGRLSTESLAALVAPFAQAGLGDLLTVSPWKSLNWQIRSTLLRKVRKLIRKKKPWSN